MTYYTHPQNLGPALKFDILLSQQGVKEAQLSLSDEPGFKWLINGELEYKDSICEWLTCYLEKKSFPKLPPLELPAATLFTERVWRKLSEVSSGSTLSYKEVAFMVGHPSAYRAVGSACRKNKHLLFVPCHRILSANGALAGYAGGEEIKRRLLAFENSLQDF